ncbi:1-deoxy-D-xylulose-5-phosphate reductoisomerase [Entomospira entomophila]|uniref:1-deoxy-D-xylulose 5-phosphate reductoisomerase n=1 Tax=Entomospira entomophila TaxID=2719988 RepID=A0A968GBK5_9SPIO|nr:1-deoxy-D-xylulose-5-phosphate reductoisomerase [Entomospira entomophilus]NIZ39924.1 1-deoxy-D-xylulose-5-phosphate reductoisomerase [Entomospira entomophilus]WDI35485.1 1-deoxy-D-xylulose-5-phosphate reductoisomerase [Entomospira entomophilus]
MMKKKIIILGATGSIGRTAIHIAKKFPHALNVVGIQAHTQVDQLLALKEDFPNARFALTGLEGVLHHDFLTGKHALKTLITTTQADLVLNAISGSNGLDASIYSLTSSKNLAIANKESIVMAGEYLHMLSKKYGVSLIPVDSEHSALYYLMQTSLPISEYIITASGGAFRGKKKPDLLHVTPKEAMAHPTWKMGGKISIDSATLANKGLEIIEAWKLLHIPVNQIKVLQHPQSFVHALIRTPDGALQAYISNTNMELPIQNALLAPSLQLSTLSYLDLVHKTLKFEEVDHETFPMVNLAYQVCHQGSLYPIAYNAANEFAVEHFQQGHLSFLDISKVVRWVIEQPYPYSFDPLNLENIWQADQWSRAMALTYYQEHHK